MYLIINKYLPKSLINIVLMIILNSCWMILLYYKYNLNINCLIRKHNGSKTFYYKYALECKLLVDNVVINLNSEFIKKQNDN